MNKSVFKQLSLVTINSLTSLNSTVIVVGYVLKHQFIEKSY